MSLDTVTVPPAVSLQHRWWLLRPSTRTLAREGCRGVVFTGTYLQASLLVFVVFQVLLAARNGFSFYRYETTPDGGRPTSSFSMALAVYDAPLGWILGVCAVLWLVWQCEIVRSYDRTVIRHGQLFHVLSWTIPFANWVAPYLNMRDINRLVGRPLKYALAVWWGLWLSAVLSGMYLRHFTGVGRQGPDGNTIIDWTILDVSWLLNSAAGIAAVVVVGALTSAFAQQTARQKG